MSDAIESRVAVIEKTVQALESRQAEIIEWKHDTVPKALADVTLRVMDVDNKLDAHLLEAAPKVAEVTRLVADVAELKGQVAGQEGLMPRLARIETEMISHGRALDAITAGQLRIEGLLHGTAEKPGVVVQQATDRVKTDTAKRVLVAVVSFFSGAIAVGAAWPEFSKVLGNLLKALSR